MRRAMAEAEVGDEQRFDDPTVNALLRARRRAARHRGRGLPAHRARCATRSRFRLHIRPGGDEVILHRTVAPDHARGRRPGGALGRDAAPARRATRGMFDAAHAARPRCARRATATRRARGSCRSSRRRTSPAGACGRSSSVRAVRRRRARGHGLRAAPRRRAADERGRRARRAGRRAGRAGFDTAWIDFTKGLGAPVGAVLAGLARADRRGVALQADDRRRDAPGGDRRRRRAVRARPPRRAAGRGPRERARAGRRAWPSSPGVELDPATVETNIVIFERAGRRARSCAALLAERRADGRRSTRARCARSRTSTSTPAGIAARARRRAQGACQCLTATDRSETLAPERGATTHGWLRPGRTQRGDEPEAKAPERCQALPFREAHSRRSPPRCDRDHRRR